MATVAQHFERLCECLEVAEELELDEASKYLDVVLKTIRPIARNQELRVWFMQRSLDLIERKVASKTPVS